MNALTTAIANYLKVKPSQVKEVRDFKCWNGGEVWLAVIQGKGARFVSKKLITMNSLFSLPVLNGSEKQIAWAEKIRQQKLEHVAGFVDDCKINSVDTKTRKACWKDIFYIEVCFPEIEQPWLAENVFNQANATFWIESKDINWLQECGRVNRQIIREKDRSSKKFIKLMQMD